MGDIGEVLGTPCFHFDRPSPDVPCPRCGMPAEKEDSRALLLAHGEAKREPMAALARLSETPMRVLGRAALPDQPPELIGKVLERLVADHARIVISTAREISSGLVPVGSKPVVVSAGETKEIELWTEMPVHGPYRLGIFGSAPIRVSDLRIGNVVLNLGVSGEIPQEHFEWQDSEWPLGLVPIRGPAWRPGTRLSLRLHNTSCFTDEVSITVWAQPEAPAAPKVSATDAITLRLSDPVQGSTLQLRDSVRPEPGEYWISNKTSAEIRLSHEETPSEAQEAFDQYRRKLKHLSARIRQLNEHVDKERGRAEELEASLRIEREQRAFWEKMHGLAAEDGLRMARQRESHPATVTWFGPSWDAPLCQRMDAHAALLAQPECQRCGGCGRVIEPGTPGILVGHAMSPPSAFHRDCWFVEIGAKAPEPGSPQALADATRRRREGACEAYVQDRRASRAHAERRPVEDDDGWGAWQSATDEGP